MAPRLDSLESFEDRTAESAVIMARLSASIEGESLDPSSRSTRSTRLALSPERTYRS